MKNPTVVKFGKRIRQLRESKKLSQRELGPKTGLHQTHIGAVERGERNLSLGSMEKIARGLGVDVGQFFPSPETLSPEGQVIEEIANLLRHKDLQVLQLVLRVAEGIVIEMSRAE